jgi:hypothetical protein
MGIRRSGIAEKCGISVRLAALAAAPEVPGWPAGIGGARGMVVFVRVNQVLVRLWARGVACLTGGVQPRPRRRRRSGARSVVRPPGVTRWPERE